jgi:hypothetical protein
MGLFGTINAEHNQVEIPPYWGSFCISATNQGAATLITGLAELIYDSDCPCPRDQLSNVETDQQLRSGQRRDLVFNIRQNM